MFTAPRLVRNGLFIVLVALTTSCLALAQATASQKATPAKNAAEKYEPLTNPSEIGLDVQVAASRVSFGNSAGGEVEGKITSLSIAGKELELTDPEIVQDANGSWINTKAYGRIKIASGALGRGLVISLKPSQKASLTKLYIATKSSK